MPLIVTYQDLFPSNTIMRQRANNGTITIPGSGDARLVAPNGADCQLHYTDVAGPLLYERLSAMWQSAHPSQPLFLETKLSAFTGTTNLRIAGLAIFTTPFLSSLVPFYSYQLGWYRNDSKLHLWLDTPTAESEVLTAVTTADPASTANLYRIYWNPYSRPLWINELSVAIQSDYLCFAYSIDNGVTWVNMGTRLRDFDFSQAYAGVFCRKWETTAVSAQADFAYFRAQEYNTADILREPDAWGRNQDRVGIEDGYVFPALAGSGRRFDLPAVGEDFAPTKDRVGFEESLFVQLDNTDFIKGKYDADGKEYLGGYAVRNILYYDATLDPWHSHGAGFYGAGRDGVLYYDGVACGPGSFGTLAGGVNRTAWSTNGQYLDAGTPTGATPTITADGELQFALSAQSTAEVSSRLRWFCTGDFDIQVDYQIISAGSGPTDGGLDLMAMMDWNNLFYVRRKLWNSNLYDKDVRNNGSYVSYASAATSDTSGKMRIVRVGSVVSSYYWSGSAWTQIGGNYTMTYARPVIVRLAVEPNASVTCTVKARNFTINSGATTNLVGWAREAAGTYRGSQSAFPQHALFCSSGNSLDIIDADTNKLWMSFRGGVGYLIGGDANFYVPQVCMKDGTLLLCYRTFDTAGTVDGYGYWIDFTLDFARCHRGPTYNDAGFYHNVELTTGVWPRDSANGAIAWRNVNRGEAASHFDNWQFQNSRANWGDLLHDGGYQYHLIANNGGAYLCKWKRWRFEGTSNEALNTPDYALSTQSVAMRWSVFRAASKDILYHGRSKLWVTSYATWSAVLGGGGGSWVEDHEYSLAGTADLYALGALAQDCMALDDTSGLLFYARNEGVYVMNLTTGVSTLVYGKAGSGATHEVLGDYATISSVKFATDGTESILFVGMARPDKIWAVNLTTHTIYWKGFQDDGHQPFSLTVGA